MAQEDKLRISLYDGNPVEFNTSDIKDISFVEDEVPLDIIGEWFCEADSIGTYESFNFYEDGTIKWFYNYFKIKSTGTKTGTYSFGDYLLKIKVPSIALQKFPIVNHSATQFTILSSGSRYNYYKVQKIFYMTTKDKISIGNEGDEVVYVDNQFIGLEGNEIKAKKAGTGYALVMDAQLNTIVAYKVIVGNPNIKVTDWTIYFDKDINEITKVFGVPDEIREDSQLQITTHIYEEHSADVRRLMFDFKNATEKVIQVAINLRTESYFENYYNNIKGKYVFHDNLSTPTELVYFDTDDKNTASVRITIYYNKEFSIFQIIYSKF